MKLRDLAVVVVAASALIAAVGGAEKVEPARIVPGPTVMSDEEKAIVADPNAGMQHGVILLLDTDFDEQDYKYSQLSYHVRAKILSNEGRGLADVEIPALTEEAELADWWGRTILPDGTSKELKKEELQEQVVSHEHGSDTKVLKGALRGVEPGCVIDYGFVYRNKSLRRLALWRRVFLQREWPVRSFRYRWVPWEPLANGFTVSRGQGLGIEASRYINTVLVAGRNIPPVVEEPWMPPDDTLRASVSFFYFDKKEHPSDYWNAHAKTVDARVRAFAPDPAPIRKAIVAMALDPNDPLPVRIRSVYDWLAGHVRLSTSAEGGDLESVRDDLDEDDYAGKKKAKTRPTAVQVLEAGEGSQTQIQLLLVAFAREIGADANLVLATERTDHYWDKNILSMTQFDESLVAIRAKEQSPDQSLLAFPGVGLPLGQIPWWVAGPKALEATAAGFHEIYLFPSEARMNRSESHVQIRFSGEADSASSAWTRSGSGQSGLSERLSLGAKALEARRKRLDDLCGAGAGFDVARAEAPKLDDSKAGFLIECEAARPVNLPEASAKEWSMKIDGPWIRPAPDLPQAIRVQPVILDFPREEQLSMKVGPPPGFKLGKPPEPIKIEGPFGAYALTITTWPEGFRVERSFSILRPKIDPPAYRGFEKFLSDVRAADRTPLVFVRAGAGP